MQGKASISCLLCINLLIVAQAMKTWYNNHWGGAKNHCVFKFKWKISLRNVVAHCCQEDVRSEVEKIFPNAKPGSQEYLSHYQQALTKLMEQLSNEEQDEYEILQKEWEDTSPLVEIQWK